MTAPNGPGGVNPDAKFVNSATGLGDLDQLTRPNVTALLKEMHFPPTNIWRNPGGVLKTAWNAMTSAISGAATNAVNALTQIGTLIWKVGGNIIDDVADFIAAAVANAQTALTNAGNALTQIGTLVWKVGGSIIDDVGDFIMAALTNAQTAMTNTGITLANLQSALKGAFDAWFGGNGGTGTPEEFTYVIGAIKDAIINGYNVIGFSTSVAGYAVPLHAEAKMLLIGGGQSGSGTTGGLHGSYLVTPVSLEGITHLDLEVGTAGNRTYVRQAHSTPHTGTLLVESPVHGSAGGIGDVFGLTPTTSLPGSGGRGGTNPIQGTVIAPTAGETTPFATGGAPGSNGNGGSSGQPGGSVSPDALIKSGGAGGGGGGGASNLFNSNGNGGSGGWPGGGGGGRGSGTGSGGTPGSGAPGVIYFFYK